MAFGLTYKFNMYVTILFEFNSSVVSGTVNHIVLLFIRHLQTGQDFKLKL